MCVCVCVCVCVCELSLSSSHTHTLSHTSQAGVDVEFFEEISTFIIPPGVTVETIPAVRIIDDILFERDEDFFVEIVSVSFGVIGFGSTQVDIIDNDG